MDLLEDEDNQSPEAKMNESMMRQEIWKFWRCANSKRKRRVSLRYGLVTSEPCTWKR
ncbi:hypothetical protein [Scytonema sp. UIC 10036]|uniref:hypothetical protein n=1 Tax=Scytonema sp. UIC 10036 TaxID=2304196 RepID=UPI001FAB0F46|nr:hypothetical protein [Scytonema sp. UIC 10036]